jgi:stage V sporulation protein B
MKGIYSMTMTIYNMPCSFIVPIAISVIPAISSQLTLKKDTGVRETEESAARVAGLISLPCSVGLGVLAEPIMALLGGYTGEKLVLASNLMRVLAVCVLLYGIIQYTNALMQAHGYAYVPVIHMLLAGACKLGVVYLLVGNPQIGILGAPIGSFGLHSHCSNEFVSYWQAGAAKAQAVAQSVAADTAGSGYGCRGIWCS